MSLKFDVEHGVAAGRDNFHSELVRLMSAPESPDFPGRLVRLMQKSDSSNRVRLAKAFPSMAQAFDEWYSGRMPITAVQLEVEEDDRYGRFARAFPQTSEAYEAHVRGEEVPDLPYEGVS